jgi:alpha-ribazole phosphatase
MSEQVIHLLRHGAPKRPGLLMGRTDGAPTPGGIAGCVRQVEGLEFSAIVSSDLRRCALAASAIGDRGGLPVTIDPRWRELDFGDWDGLPASAVDAALLARFWSDPDRNLPPNGERWSTLIARIAAAWAALDQSPSLVITHGGAMRAMLAHLCGFDHRQAWAFDLPYGALLSLRVWPGEQPSAQIIGLRT